MKEPTYLQNCFLQKHKQLWVKLAEFPSLSKADLYGELISIPPSVPASSTHPSLSCFLCDYAEMERFQFEGGIDKGSRCTYCPKFWPGVSEGIFSTYCTHSPAYEGFQHANYTKRKEQASAVLHLRSKPEDLLNVPQHLFLTPLHLDPLVHLLAMHRIMWTKVSEGKLKTYAYHDTLEKSITLPFFMNLPRYKSSHNCFLCSYALRLKDLTEGASEKTTLIPADCRKYCPAIWHPEGWRKVDPNKFPCMTGVYQEWSNHLDSPHVLSPLAKMVASVQWTPEAYKRHSPLNKHPNTTWIFKKEEKEERKEDTSIYKELPDKKEFPKAGQAGNPWNTELTNFLTFSLENIVSTTARLGNRSPHGVRLKAVALLKTMKLENAIGEKVP